MSAVVSPLDQLIDQWGKLTGNLINSEEQRAMAPITTNNNLNRTVSADQIRIFLDGEGDLNPLYRNPEYAQKTKYKCLIAPPNYLYTISYAQHPEGRVPMIPGIAGFYSGCDREWFRPVCDGDNFTYRVIFPSEIKVKSSKFAGRIVLGYEKTDYYKQGGEIVAGYSSYETWAEIEKIKEMNKYGNLAKMPEYSEKEIEEIYAAQDREEIRGSNPRYWEDVEEGDELTPVVRGPMSENERDAWMAGGHFHKLSDKLNRSLWVKEPMTIISTFAGREPPAGFKAAHPRPAVAGQQPEAWRYVLLTNWMGDDGFLWKFNSQIRMFTMMGDTTWVKGKVIKKYLDDGKYCVDIDIQNTNQNEVVTIKGTATVILPSREHGPVVYPKPYNRVPQQ